MTGVEKELAYCEVSVVAQYLVPKYARVRDGFVRTAAAAGDSAAP
jgi:hypothetical protein